MKLHKPMMITGIVALGIGLVVGWLIWHPNPRAGMHQMPDGTMMNNDGTMASMMHDMNAALRGKTGNAFDQEFLNQMIVHHQGAVDMAKLVLETSKRPELIKLANDIIVAQTREIDMMQSWRVKWFGK